MRLRIDWPSVVVSALIFGVLWIVPMWVLAILGVWLCLEQAAKACVSWEPQED